MTLKDEFDDLVPPAARRWIVATIMFMLAFAGGVWWIMRPVPVIETAAPEKRQADGSLILERQPTTPTAQPKQQTPRRAKVERIASVTVQPDAPSPAAGKPCPPVTVDLSLIRERDGGRRILASSPDGQVVGGLDIPVEMNTMPKAKRWAAGLSWSPIEKTYGAWGERDVEIPFVNLAARIGADVNQASSGVDARIRVGVAF